MGGRGLLTGRVILSFPQWLSGYPGDKGRALGLSHPFCHLLEPEEEELKPHPGKQQQDDHGREGKTEPGGKIHHIAIVGEDPEEGMQVAE